MKEEETTFNKVHEKVERGMKDHMEKEKLEHLRPFAFTDAKIIEDHIREYHDIVEWDIISRNQKLSESFIREFQDRVDWSIISTRQRLSEDFIREFQDKVDWYRVYTSQSLSKEFIQEFKPQIQKSVDEFLEGVHVEYQRALLRENMRRN